MGRRRGQRKQVGQVRRQPNLRGIQFTYKANFPHRVDLTILVQKREKKKQLPGILRLTVYSNPEGQICTTKSSILKSDQPIRFFILTNKIAPAGRLEISKPTHGPDPPPISGVRS